MKNYWSFGLWSFQFQFVIKRLFAFSLKVIPLWWGEFQLHDELVFFRIDPWGPPEMILQFCFKNLTCAHFVCLYFLYNCKMRKFSALSCHEVLGRMSKTERQKLKNESAKNNYWSAKMRAPKSKSCQNPCRYPSTGP